MTAPAPRRRGRPSAHEGKNKARAFTLTMTDAGHDAVDAGAAAAGMSKNDYVEMVVLAARRAPEAARARCPHVWPVGNSLVRCALPVGHRAPHAWGAKKDDRT